MMQKIQLQLRQVLLPFLLGVTSMVFGQAPLADFTANQTTICDTSTAVLFTNMTTPATNVTYVWDFGDGSPTSTDVNPSHTYTTFGTFTVTLTATNTVNMLSATETKTAFITVKPLCADFFEANGQTTGCGNLTAFFQCNVQSLEPIVNYQWDLGGVAGLDSCNTQRIYSQIGSYTIRLIVTDAVGRKDTMTKVDYITIYSNPILSFTASQVSGCGTLDVVLTNTSMAAGNVSTTSLWTIGGTPYSTNTVNHTINTPSCQSLFLQVTTPEGCKSDTFLNNYLCVKPLPVAVFSASIANTCDTVTQVNFTNNSTHNASLNFQWDFGDNSGTSTAQNPTYTYNTFGTFPITLIATDPVTGCSDTTVQNFTINPNNVINFTYSPLAGRCPNAAFQFTDQTIGNVTSWLWNFGDGSTSTQQNPSHSYTTPGCYTVTLTTTIGTCVLTKTVDCLTVFDLPSGSFTRTAGAKKGCSIPHNVTFDATVNNTANFYWMFEGAPAAQNQLTPTHTFTAIGTYPISLVMISSEGCTTTVSMDTITIQNFVVDFEADTTQGCLPVAVVFTNKTTPVGGLTSMVWNFGDGNTAPIITNTLSHGYGNTGEYTVSLTATNSFGCTATETKTDYILVGSVPSLDFTVSPNPSCVNAPMTFTNLSDPNAGNFVWDFGAGGGTSSDVNPTYAYQDTGVYSITLSADYNGCENSVLFQDTIQVIPPIAIFDVELTCEDFNTVKFLNQSNAATIFSWDFGNGDTSNLVSPTYTYPTLGVYTVTLTAFNTLNGCSHTTSEQINLLEPVADFESATTQDCIPAPANVVLVNNSINGESYAWQSSGGSISGGDTSSFSPVYNFDSAGIYDITLVITDERGCTDTTTQTFCISDVFFVNDTVSSNAPNDSLNTLNGSTAELYCSLNDFVSANGQQNTDTLACYWSGCTPLTVAFRDSSYSFPDTTITWLWDFGNGDTSHQQHPIYTYNESSGNGAYFVTLTITNVYGSTATDTVAVIRPAQPVAAFELADTIYCENEDIGIDNNSTGLAISYLWDFGNGDTSTVRQPNYAFDSIGTYQITLTVTDKNGCDSTISKTIVVERPIANFGADTTYSDCAALTVVFADSSVNAVAWDWNFGTGNPVHVSTLQNPTFTFSVSGTYNIRLIITSAAGCQDTIIKQNLIIVDGPKASYGFGPTNGCIDHEVTFFANGINVAKYMWVTGSVDSITGIPDTITHISSAATDTLKWTYFTDSTFFTQLLVEDQFGCPRSYNRTTPVITTNPQARFSIDTTAGCAPLSIQLINNSTYANQYKWRAPGGTISNSTVANPTITFNNAGLYDTIQLIITDVNGCRDTTNYIDTVFVSDVFAGFAADTLKGCVPLPITFTDTSTTFLGTLTQLNWNLGDGTLLSGFDQVVNHTYATVPPLHGRRLVRLTATNSWGCSDLAAVYVVPSFPSVSFTVSDTFVCTGQTVNFTNLSSGRNVTYAWDFGDSSTATTRHASHFFQAEGPYTICLTVTDENGCDSTFCKSIIVGNPHANFGADVTYSACPPLVTTFSDSSLNAISWQWNLGNGVNLPLQNPVGVYIEPGNYDVTLIVTSQSGCKDTLTKIDYISLDGPLGNFAYSPLVGCQPLGVRFEAVSEGAASGFLDFGNGSVVPIPNIAAQTLNDTFKYTKIYNQPGFFVPKMSITDVNGCTRVLSNLDTLKITDPKAIFTLDVLADCHPFVVQANGTASTYAASYQWFAPGATPITSNAATQNFIYSSPSIDTVMLVITDINGCTDTARQQVIASETFPAGTASVDIGCRPLLVNFTDNSTTVGGTITDWLWTFGDGATSTAQNPTHTYTSRGTFIVQLKTTNSLGCSTTENIDTITVTFPDVDFTMSNNVACTFQTLTFGNMSTGVNPSYSWNFGDGSPAVTTLNASHAYANEGTYNVCLTVTDENNCDSTYCQSVTIADPVANFTANPTYQSCPSGVYQMVNSSVNAVSWVWNVYDGNDSLVANSTLETPIFTLDIPDFYDVQLIVTSASGCLDSLRRNNYLELDGPKATYSVSPIIGCEPLSIDFTINTDNVVSYTLYYGDGDSLNQAIGTPTSTNVFTHVFDDGLYTPTLAIRDGAGCERILTLDNLDITPFNVDFLADDTLHCEAGTVQFTSQILTTLPISSVLWKFEGADVPTSTALNPSISYSAIGDYDVTLIIGNGFCLDSITKTDFIKIAPNPATAYMVVPDSVCVPRTVTFTSASTIFSGTIDSLIWDFGYNNQGDTNTTMTTFLYDVANTYTTQLTAISNYGCVNTESKIHTIYPLPVVAFAQSDTFVCTGQDVTFTNLSTGSNLTYIWDFADGSTSTATDTVHNFATEGSYNVCLTALDQYGCTSTICERVTVANPVANFLATATYDACPPAIFTFNNNSVNEVSWQWYVTDTATLDTVATSTLEFPQININYPGTFDVSLTVTSQSGCQDVMLRQAYLKVDGPSVEFSNTPLIGCEPLAADFFFDTYNVSQLIVLFDDGDSIIENIASVNAVRNIQHTYSAGTYTPTFRADDGLGCVREFDMSEVEVTPFNVDFMASDTLLCEAGTIGFTNQVLTTQPIDYILWRFEGADIATSTNPNPSISYSTVGDFDVKLIVGNGFCLDSLNKADLIKIAPNPMTSFIATPDSSCVPQTVMFNSTSSILSGTIDSLYWLFDHNGMGDTNTIATSHLYDVADTFNVSLTTVSDFGCSTNSIVPVIVYPLPVPDFAVSDTFVCTGQSISFTNLTAATEPTYVWNFGDGMTDTATNPIHAFATEGTFTICLTAKDRFGCEQIICRSIVVANPVAAFSADTTYGPCIVQDIHFIDNSINAVAWHWSFGDGDTSILQTPLHTYQAPGLYDVTLIVTSQSGCFDTLTINNYITIDGPSGSFSFTPISGCVPQDVGFTAVGDSITQYTWYFGNGDSLVNINNTQTDMTVYTYQVGNVYFPTLKIEDSKGCYVMLAAPDSLIVDELSVDFTVDEPILCTQGTANYTSTITSNQAIDSVRWFFEGAVTPQSTLLNPSGVFYNTLGVYDVTLIVHSGFCSDTILKPDFIRVAPTPVANFTYGPNPICTDVPFTFTDNSTLLTGNLTAWQWSDGQGYTDANANPALYSSSTASTINMLLMVTSDYGCTDDTLQAITVFQTPTADAGPDQHICINDVAYLQGTGAGTYQWTPSASLSCSTCPDPIANPLTPTVYQLLVTTADGCTDTDLMNLDVGPFALPVIGLNSSSITICKGEVTQLFASGGVDVTSYLWDTSRAGLSCYTHCLNPFASPDVTTTYVVQVTGVGGCVNYDSITVIVVQDNGTLAGADVTICEGESYQLSTAFGNNPTWSPQGELSCTFCPDPIATPSQTTTYTVTVTGGNGCTITDSVTVTIVDLASIEVGSDAIVCAGSTVQLNATGTGSIVWSPTTGLDNPLIFNPTVTTTTDITYIGTVTNGNCIIQDTLTVFVSEQASISGMDAVICEGESVQLQVTGLAQSVIWTPANTLTNANSFSPIAFPTETTTYEVIGTLENCLNDTAYVTVIVEPIPSIGIAPTATAITGQMIQLANGDPTYTYQWSPNISISCLDCPAPYVQPDTAITYTVTYQTPFGCENTETVHVSLENSCDESQIGLPQAFSPNGDGLNDIFYVRSSALSEIIEFRIYNQWGEEVFARTSQGNSRFRANDENFGWDGTYKGQPAMSGVYIYQVIMRCPINGSNMLKKDNFLLVR